MFILANKKYLLRKIVILVFLAIFLAVFGAVYEIFSHHVYSYSMIYAFGYPLLWAFILLLFLAREEPKIPVASIQTMNVGVAALALGSIVQGVVDIYGTDQHLLRFMFYAGVALAALSVILFFAGRINHRYS